MSQAARTMNSLNGIQPSTVPFLEERWQTRQRVVLTLDGQKELLVQDLGSYELLRALVERLETIEGVKRSMEAFERGEGRPAREAIEELRQKYGLSS